MINFTEARQMMVDGQIRTSDVTNLRVVTAFLNVPREKFVPKESVGLAYLDRDLPVGGRHADRPARFLIRPMVLARLVQAANIEPDDLVLVVGCTTGYSAAVIAQLASAVVALDEDQDLTRQASAALASEQIGNVDVVAGPLAAGWPVEGPYDVVLLDGGAEVIPQPLFQQIKEGGRLVGILQRGPVGQGTVFRMTGGNVTADAVFDAPAPILPGFARPPEFVF